MKSRASEVSERMARCRPTALRFTSMRRWMRSGRWWATPPRIRSGGRRYPPYVFTEQGVAMLSAVLRSRTAVTVNIAIMRAFVELRRAALSYDALERRLTELERESRRDSANTTSSWLTSSKRCDN